LVLLTFAIWECERYRRGHRYTLFEAVGFARAKRDRLSRMNIVRKKAVMGVYDTGEIVAGVVEWGGDTEGGEGESVPVA
jgi:hypothetical protein